MDFRAKIRYTTRWKGPQKKWGNSKPHRKEDGSMLCSVLRTMAVVLAMTACVALGDDYDWNYDKTARTAADDEVSSVGSLANGAAVLVPLAVAGAGDAGDLDSR